MNRLLILEEELLKWKEFLEEELAKAEAKPERPGTFHGETHKMETVRGNRKVAYPKKNPDGSEGMGFRNVPNKITITHKWDNNKKEWNHVGTESSVKSGSLHVKTPDDAAREKMKAHEESKNKEPSKPKTIVRKK